MEGCDLLEFFQEFTVVNWHEHVWGDASGSLDMTRLNQLIKAAKAAGTHKLVVSSPVMRGSPTPGEVSRCNNLVYEATRLYPGFIYGMCFVNPGYAQESAEEIKRCASMGFVGVKLYNQYPVSDPVVRGVLRLCAQMGLPVLQHAGKLNFRPEDQPFISDGTHFAKAAEEFPETTIVYAHVGGGGDWLWPLKAIAPYPNIYADISGSICDEGLVEQTVAYLGAERVLFGTDMSYCAGYGKIMGARISKDEKRIILNNPRFAGFLKGGAAL
jgi:predicted TIM-barrel fold metal-dependent hydrolase